MIFGIGSDVVRVSRIARALERHGERFAQRLLSEAEFAEFRRAARPAYFLAKRFAAKEAAVKAFGTGFRDGIALRDIAVGHDALGKPLLIFAAAAAQQKAKLGVGETFLSLSDDEDIALAFVVMMRSAQV